MAVSYTHLDVYKRQRPPNPRKPHGGNNGPSNLFNAMISPLIPLSIKGVIWYQGEFNSGGSAKEYATLFSRMIMDWREKWGDVYKRQHPQM